MKHQSQRGLRPAKQSKQPSLKVETAVSVLTTTDMQSK